MADTSEQILENANAPKKATVKGDSFEQHSIQDQILADEFAAKKAAVKKKGFGAVFVKIKPGGTV